MGGKIFVALLIGNDWLWAKIMNDIKGYRIAGKKETTRGKVIYVPRLDFVKI